MTDRPETDGEWSRFRDGWGATFLAWRHTSGAIVWRLDSPDEPGPDNDWCYSSDAKDPRHGDYPGNSSGAPPYEPSLADAKRLALALRSATEQEANWLYSARLQIKMHDSSPTANLQLALEQVVYQLVPAGVWVEGLVLTTRRGWRARVLQFAMWLIEASGHTVIRHPDRGAS